MRDRVKRSLILSAFFLSEAHAHLLPTTCAHKEEWQIIQQAEESLDRVTEQLLNDPDSPFVGYVEGVARLGIDNTTGEFLGVRTCTPLPGTME